MGQETCSHEFTIGNLKTTHMTLTAIFIAMLIMICIALGFLVVLVLNNRPCFAFLCIAGASVWAILMYIFIAFSGWGGDGSAGNGNPITGNARLFFYSPSFCLSFYALASVRFIPKWLGYLLLFVSTIPLLVFLGLILIRAPSFVIWVFPFIFYGLSAFWPWLKQKYIKGKGMGAEKGQSKVM